MCPACIANAAVMAAGTASTGILAVCLNKFIRLFRMNRLSLSRKEK